MNKAVGRGRELCRMRRLVTRGMSSSPLRPLLVSGLLRNSGSPEGMGNHLLFHSLLLGTTLLSSVPDPCQESLRNCLKGCWLPPCSADPMQDAPPWPSFSPFSPRETGTSVHLTVWNSGEDTYPFRGAQTALRCRP